MGSSTKPTSANPLGSGYAPTIIPHGYTTEHVFLISQHHKTFQAIKQKFTELTQAAQTKVNPQQFQLIKDNFSTSGYDFIDDWEEEISDRKLFFKWYQIQPVKVDRLENNLGHLRIMEHLLDRALKIAHSSESGIGEQVEGKVMDDNQEDLKLSQAGAKGLTVTDVEEDEGADADDEWDEESCTSDDSDGSDLMSFSDTESEGGWDHFRRKVNYASEASDAESEVGEVHFKRRGYAPGVSDTESEDGGVQLRWKVYAPGVTDTESEDGEEAYSSEVSEGLPRRWKTFYPEASETESEEGGDLISFSD